MGTSVSPWTVMTSKPVASDRKSTRLNSSHLVISYAVFCSKRTRPQSMSLFFPYTTLFRSPRVDLEPWRVLGAPAAGDTGDGAQGRLHRALLERGPGTGPAVGDGDERVAVDGDDLEAGRLRSEEHTSELQSPCNLVCRLLLEKNAAAIYVSILSLHDALPISARRSRTMARARRPRRRRHG